MDLGLRAKNVVVTGGSRGIGRAIALTFADEGANVAICAKGEAALEKTAAELRLKNVSVCAKPCDIADAKALEVFLGSR
jgi:3-oxoacyl-[acyl-carrier protein] reductase